MSLLRLAPECMRLRRMAKAHAAGEMSQSAYRDARRAVIDGFAEAPLADDDTRRRGEPTLRSRTSTEPVSAAAAWTATQPSVALHTETPEAPADAPGWRSKVALAAALTGLLIVLLGWPSEAGAQAGSAGLDIPAVRDRHPDPARSPRLPVLAVQIRWADSPSAGTGAAMEEFAPGLLAELQAVADARLDELQTAAAPGGHGFTASELEEIGRFLDVLGVHGDASQLDAADARDLAALINEQKRRRGVSVAQLEDVARAVQSKLRAAGYFLGVAYLPAQSVADGVVAIGAMPGRLGEIVVEGGDPGPADHVFAGLNGAPLTLSDVTGRLETLNALPGVSAQASFGPGAEVGASTLRLDLLEQRRWSAGIGVDNHGDDATGEQRVTVTGAWLNPRGVGDRLSAGLLTTVNPGNQTYGYLDYDTPLAAGYRLSARFGNNQFTRDGGAAAGSTDLDGSGRYLDIGARRAMVQSRERRLTAILGLARHDLDWDDGVDQQASMISAGLVGHRVWDGPRIAADVALNATLGHLDGDPFMGQDSDFWLLELDAEAWMPLALPLLAGEQKLRLSAAGQWSDTLLPATRRLALGGAQRARAFDRSTFIGDRGLVLGAEVRTPLAVGELLLFAESAYGDDRTSGAERWAHLGDLGIGWTAVLGPGVSTRLNWALPVTSQGTGDLNDDDARWYWSLDYHY